MRLRIKPTFVLSLAIAVLLIRFASSQTPGPTPAMDKPMRSELAVDSKYVRSNAPSASCTCFNMNGVSATFAWPVKPGQFAVAGDVAIDHTGTIRAREY